MHRREKNLIVMLCWEENGSNPKCRNLRSVCVHSEPRPVNRGLIRLRLNIGIRYTLKRESLLKIYTFLAQRSFFRGNFSVNCL